MPGGMLHSLLDSVQVIGRYNSSGKRCVVVVGVIALVSGRVL